MSQEWSESRKNEASERLCVVAFQIAVDAREVGRGDDAQCLFSEYAVLGDDDRQQVLLFLKGDEYLEDGRVLTHDDVALQNRFMQDIPHGRLGKEVIEILARAVARLDLGVQPLGVDDAQHRPVFVHDQ